MTSTPDEPTRALEELRFGAFRLVPWRRELFLRDAPVAIGARALDLLVALLARRGRLATKHELIAEVWPGRVVDENNLAAQISALRKLLANDPGLEGALQTVPGQGYRCLADVATTEAGRAVRAPSSSGADALSLVLLPFVHLGGDVERAYFAQGLSHTVATDLSRIPGLLVIAPSTANAYADRGLDARALSQELAVRYVLAGSVQRSAGRVRVNVQLLDGASGRPLWSDLLDGDDARLFELQDRITGRIANAMGRAIFTAAAEASVASRVDPRSFDHLLRGIAADNRPQSLEVLREQELCFARAVALDPRHADAFARLSRALLLQVTQVHAPARADASLIARGVEAAETAMRLDPRNARAHCAIGLVHVLRGDFDRAVPANETAILLDRNFAIAHNNLGNSLVHLGHGQEALDAADKALRLDPRGPQICAFHTTRGFAQLLMGDIEDALASFLRAQAANPNLPRARLGAAVALALRGDRAGAAQARDDLLRLAPHYRLSETMDACMPRSTPRYRRFHEEVLGRGAQLAGVPA